MRKDQGKGGINKFVKGLLKLSVAEGKVLVLVAEGKTSQEIAGELFRSPRTVEKHRQKICDKLNLPGPGALNEWIDECWPEK